MTQDEIIRMARESGLGWVAHKRLERFAALVAARERRKCEQEMALMEEHCAELILIEREACAKVCEEIDMEYEGEDVLSTWCAAAIRSRSNAS